MAKKIYHITKYRFYAVTLSVLFLLAGVIGWVIFNGFNLGIDFQSGYSLRFQIAQPALSVSYTGNDEVMLSVDQGNLVLAIRNASGSQTMRFSASEYPTVSELATAVSSAVPGLSAVAIEATLPTDAVIAELGMPVSISSEPFIVKCENRNTASYRTIDEVRKVLDPRASVQVVGEEYRQIFQVRLTNEENATEEAISTSVLDSLHAVFGPNSIVKLQSDFVGPKYSASLISESILIVVLAIALILIYIWIRFKLAYALAAIINLIHDTLFLVSFIILFQLEVSSTTIAALLTIIGYSLNNVIVIFDRIRENRVMLKDLSMMQLIDTSVSQSLSRTLFSSLTTVLAILPMAIFASGAIQLFAIEMVFGISIGAYSCNFMAPALFLWISKNKKIEKGKAAKAIEKTPAKKDQIEQVEKQVVSQDIQIPVAERKLKGKRQQKKK